MGRSVVAKLLSAVTTTGAGTAVKIQDVYNSFHFSGSTTAGSGAASIKIQVSNAATPGTNDWIDLGDAVALTLSSTSTNDGFTKQAPWLWIRANVASISGTNAAVTVDMCTFVEDF